VNIRCFNAMDSHTLRALSAVLMDCVAGGASVSFMAPLSRDKADAFWSEVIASAVRGERLLLVAEDMLDTAGSGAERLYVKMGWQRCGVIPDYALLPDGGLCDTTVFYRRL
jgi:hypothetical protein